MSKLTKKELAWIARVQKALDSCPSKKKFGFFTIGDNDVMLYDLRKRNEIDNLMDSDGSSSNDFGPAVDEANARFDDSLRFSSPVESTAG